jgi:hypothetical protein
MLVGTFYASATCPECHAKLCSLSLAQILPPVICGNLTRRIMPWLQLFNLFLIYLIQVLRCASEKVSRSQDLGYMLSSYSPHIMEVAYVRCMVVECEVVVYDRIVGVVCFQQMLEGSRSLFGGSFNVMDFHRGEVDGEMCAFSSAKEGGQ